MLTPMRPGACVAAELGGEATQRATRGAPGPPATAAAGADRLSFAPTSRRASVSEAAALSLRLESTRKAARRGILKRMGAEPQQREKKEKNEMFFLLTSSHFTFRAPSLPLSLSLSRSLLTSLSRSLLTSLSPSHNQLLPSSA